MTVPFDYYSPFVSAAIFNPETDIRVPLWTQVDKTSARQLGLPEQLQSLAFLQEVTVEINQGEVPRIEATLTPPFRDAQLFIDSPLVEWGISNLEVQFGYTGGAPEGAFLTELFTGVLLKPNVTLGADASITLTAQGVAGFSASRQQGNLTVSNSTRLNIIEQLAAGASAGGNTRRRMQVDASRVVQAGGDAAQLLCEEPITYAQAYATDWWSIWTLVREARCTMSLEGDILKIFSTNDLYAQPPKREFRLFDFPGGKIGPVEGVFPILSVSTPTTAVYMPGVLRGLAMGDINSATREASRVWVGDEEAQTTRTQNGAAQPQATQDYPARSEDDYSGGSFFPGDPNDNVALAQARAEYDAFTSGMGVKLLLTSLGDPGIKPSDVISVKGVSRRIDGNFAILKLTHRVGLNGYEMDIEAVSNVGQVLSSTDTDFEPAGPQNTSTLDPSEAGTVGSPAPAPAGDGSI